MVQVDTVADVFLCCQGHHLFGRADLVADGFFAKDMQARLERLHGRRMVITAIFFAARGNTDHGQVRTRQHVRHGIEGGHAQARGGFIRPRPVNVAHRHEFCAGISRVYIRVPVPDRAKPNNAYMLHPESLFLR